MRILITGTDTAVGKTWIACALAHALRAAGKQVVAIKPVETGCAGRPSDQEDGRRLARATGQTQPTQAIVRLAEPVAPMLASERAGTEIDFDALVLKIERYTANAEFALIEGAGGLLAPVTWEWNMTDVARAVGACALVVAADRLGTINHALLTLSALELAGIPCAGVVLTRPELADPSTGSNATAIARLSGIDRVVALRRAAAPEWNDENNREDAGSMARLVDWLGGVLLGARSGER